MWIRLKTPILWWILAILAVSFVTALIMSVVGCNAFGKRTYAEPPVYPMPGTVTVPGINLGRLIEADGRLLAVGMVFITLGGIAVALSFWMKSNDMLMSGGAGAGFGLAIIVLAVLLKPIVWIGAALLLFLAVMLAWFLVRKMQYKAKYLGLIKPK